MSPVGNDEIQTRITRRGAEGKAPSIDITHVKALGAKRRRTRRTALAALGGLSVCGIAAALIANSAINPGRVNQPASPGIAAPGCAPFGAVLVDSAASGKAVRTLSAKANSALTFNAVVPDEPRARYTSLDIIIAKPGVTVDAGQVDQLPATSAARPENQLSKTRIDAPGAKFTLEVQSPATPGSYPIVGYGTFVKADGCTVPIPTDPAKQQTAHYAFEMGTLIIQP